MSLINKMLQDLDARGAAAVQTLPGKVRPVPGRHRSAPFWWAGAALLVLAAAALAWRYFAQVAPQSAAAAPTVAPAPAVSPSAPPALAPAVPPSAARLPFPAPAVPPSAPPTLAPAVPPSAPRPRARAPQPATAASSAGDLAALPPVKARSGPVKRAPTPLPEWRAQGAQGVAAPPVADTGRELSPKQEAEGAYRKALSDLQDGRSRAAMNGLEQALRIDARHDAARQTLIGLLLENKRQDEAIQQLKQGLALDPGQIALAMALARLQVEQGGPALQTLLRSLPYASERADYQAFVAALMEREQRHKEAVGYYETALRLSPQNGVWWMGLGISLQADQRLQEARIAYQRARTTGRLAPELDSFVEKKLQQLAR